MSITGHLTNQSFVSTRRICRRFSKMLARLCDALISLSSDGLANSITRLPRLISLKLSTDFVDKQVGKFTASMYHWNHFAFPTLRKWPSMYWQNQFLCIGRTSFYVSVEPVSMYWQNQFGR